MTTTAIAPRLPDLLQGLKEEFIKHLELELEPEKIDKRAEQMLFQKILEQGSNDLKVLISDVTYFSPDCLPKDHGLHVAAARDSLQRIEQYCQFRDTLKRFEKLQAESARTLDSGPDFEIEES